MKRIFRFPTFQVFLLGFLLAITNSCITEVDPKLLPVLTTIEATKITEATAQTGGSITSDAGFDIIARGVCWSTSPNPTVKDSITKDAAGSGIFESRIMRLTPNTTYYVRAYATNKKGTSYGLQATFKTKSFAITTSDITAITVNTALSGGTIVSDGDSVNVSVRGICWGTQSSPTIINNKTVNGKGVGKFSSPMTELILGTTYYVRAYATNTAGTIYGNELTFITLDGVMTLTTNAATSITATSVTIGGSVPSDSGSPVTERGLCISKLPSPTISNKIVNGSGTGAFANNITGLTANTTYYIRAFATNSIGTAYGNEVSFTTQNGIIELTTTDISSITSTTISIGGTISTDGGAVVTARGACWSTSTNPTISDSKTVNGSGIGTFSSSITGLTAETNYYIRAYATNSVGTAYGAEIAFSTKRPSIITTAISDIAANSATCGGNITAIGGATIIARGICWSATPNPTIATSSKTTNGLGAGEFASSITGLMPGKTYYVKAYATNSIGTSYGSELSFTTIKILPTISTASAIAITPSTANCGGNISADGGADITSRGVCWSTSQNPTTNENKTNDGIGTSSFTSSLTGLSLGTTYYIRAYATNSIGTAYGSQIVFTQTYTIGMSLLGGKIAYIDASGIHGFVCAPSPSPRMVWLNGSNLTTGATNTLLETTGVYGISKSGGRKNTEAIIAAQGTGIYAASYCYNLTIGGATSGDWYLPSKGELNQLYINKDAIGGFEIMEYWSSSENSSNNAWFQSFGNGTQNSYSTKNTDMDVRAIRAF